MISPFSIQKSLVNTLLEMANAQALRVLDLRANQKVKFEHGDFPCHTVHSNNSLDADFTDFVQIHTSHFVLEVSCFSSHWLIIDVALAGEDQRQANQRTLDKKNTLQYRVEIYSSVGISVSLTSQLIGENATEFTAEKNQLPSLDNSRQQAFCSLLDTIVASLDTFYTQAQRDIDKLSGCITRNAFERLVSAEIDSSNGCIVLVHCSDLLNINRKFGHDQGDKAIAEIANIIVNSTRKTDIVSRFGGALFGVFLTIETAEQSQVFAQKLLNNLTKKAFLDGSLRCQFKLGISKPSQELGIEKSAQKLILQSEKALGIAQGKDNQPIVNWDNRLNKLISNEKYQLGQIFTADSLTNYRNMQLLWDLSSMIADEHQFNHLIESFIGRLGQSFNFQSAGITCEKQIKVAYSLDINGKLEPLTMLPGELGSGLWSVIRNAQDHSALHSSQMKNHFISAISLGDDLKECLFFITENKAISEAKENQLLLEAFARHIGKALKRSKLEEALAKQLEQQNAELTKQVEVLQAKSHGSSLVYQSKSMQTLMLHAQKAAQTDTTVLINGESGTGKEKLIQAIHSLSPRSNKPLIIVDCGAIPENLIESELFGHIKGAFTGALSEKVGKIKAAHGGTLVLDEIGELPLSMQPKLLRFVQEKSFTAVGSHKLVEVDVKIVAVTNRDLQQEVEAGRFRKDLFYRLNVVKLLSPPLRERIEDLEILSQHFISKCCYEHKLPERKLSKKAGYKMSLYNWPGNIRELENRITQACVLSQTPVIEFEDLNILESELNQSHHKQVVLDNSLGSSTPYLYRSTDDMSNSSTPWSRYDADIESPSNSFSKYSDEWQSELDDAESAEYAWLSRMERAIKAFVHEVNGNTQFYNLVVGDEIEEQLFRLCQRKLRNNKAVADKLNIPISTARRKILKVLDKKEPSDMPISWTRISKLLHQLVTSDLHLNDPVQAIKYQVVAQVLNGNPQNMTRAATQIGVSEPTLYKLKRQLSDPAAVSSLC